MTKDDRLFGPVMRVRNGQCIALSGTIGVAVKCRIYEDRPRVCREFTPGCDLCLDVRARDGIPVDGTDRKVEGGIHDDPT